MRCENKERHTLLAARSWSSTLLAAQRGGRNDAAGQIDYSRITYTLLGDVSTLIEVNFSPLSRRYTLEELWASPERDDHAHYNLIAGYLFIVPPECLGCKTSVYDRTTKADTYLALGVRELWLIDPETETIEVRYASKVGEITVWKILKYSRGQHAASRMLEGYRVSVDDLFNEVKERFSHG